MEPVRVLTDDGTFETIPADRFMSSDEGPSGGIIIVESMDEGPVLRPDLLAGGPKGDDVDLSAAKAVVDVWASDPDELFRIPETDTKDMS